MAFYCVNCRRPDYKTWCLCNFKIISNFKFKKVSAWIIILLNNLTIYLEFITKLIINKWISLKWTDLKFLGRLEPCGPGLPCLDWDLPWILIWRSCQRWAFSCSLKQKIKSQIFSRFRYNQSFPSFIKNYFYSDKISIASL